MWKEDICWSSVCPRQQTRAALAQNSFISWDVARTTQPALLCHDETLEIRSRETGQVREWHTTDSLLHGGDQTLLSPSQQPCCHWGVSVWLGWDTINVVHKTNECMVLMCGFTHWDRQGSQGWGWELPWWQHQTFSPSNQLHSSPHIWDHHTMWL